MDIQVIRIIVLAVDNAESKSTCLEFFRKENLLDRYKIVLNSDSKPFDGHGRINDQQEFFTENIIWDEREYSIRVTKSFINTLPILSFCLFRFIFQRVLH